ncbi:MAG: radical SAM protein [Ignavibacteria bacterium]|nr:radical SAM protein [Ignavibacteria bacterium]
MKIFLTHGYYLNSDPNEMRIMKPYVPLGILYISAYLKQHGFDTTVYDSTFRSFEEQKKALIAEKPDVIAIYCNLMTKLNVLPLVKFIRQSDELKSSKIILGGPEPPHHASEFLKYGADIIVEGEGEETMLDLCRELSNSQAELSKVNGIYFKHNSTVVKNPTREKIKDIDVLPFPDRAAVDLSLYLDAWKNAHGYSSVSINTMRGCPYTCKWCSHTVYGVSYRRRSPEKTADEIEYIIQNYNPDMLWFVDDVFTVSHKWLTKLLQVFKERGIKIKFECISRSDRLNEDVIKILKQLGCFRLWIGAESGSQHVLNLMDRRVSAADTREKIKLTRRHGIEAGTFIMLGYPGERKQDIIETTEHLKDSNPDIFLTTVAYPIKGTPFYAEVESRLVTDKQWHLRTDRDLDFKGRYSKNFYKHANRYMVNEVNYFKMKTSGAGFTSYGKTYVKAKISRIMMSLVK